MDVVPRRRGTIGGDDTVQTLRGVLHDIGHEMAVMGYLVTSLLDEPSVQHPAYHRVELIDQQVARLLQLLRRSIMPGGHEPAPEPVALGPLLNQLATQARLAGPARVLVLCEPVELRVDATLLWRIVTNLLDNATRAAGPGGQVDITVTAREEVTLEIADDGPGFGAAPPGWAQTGLNTVAGLADSCGATLRIANRYPHGARVQVVFPRGRR